MTLRCPDCDGTGLIASPTYINYCWCEIGQRRAILGKYWPLPGDSYDLTEED